MKGLLLALIAFSAGLQQPNKDNKLIAGMWKVDPKVGFAVKAAELGQVLDWIIVFNEDGTYKWTVYEPLVPGKGRRFRETKGTYVVNLRDDLIVLKTKQLTTERVALQGILGEDRKTFVIPPTDPKRDDLKIKFYKVEVYKPPTDGG